MNNKIYDILAKLPKVSGVYKFFNKTGKIIYIGKASVLKHRVRSYFIGAHDNKTEKLVSEIANIKWQVTPSVIEALILESNLIKKYQPTYNVREKDDKSFVQIALTKEDFPRFVLLRPTQEKKLDVPIKKYFGPYTDAGAIKEVLEIFRHIFTYRDCSKFKFNRYRKSNNPCIYYPMRLCPAPCVGKINKKEYNQIVKQISDFLAGKNKQVISSLRKQMRDFSDREDFENAAKIRDKIFAFEHINDVALIKKQRTLEQIKNIPVRIECYDISNIGADFAVGSMVVFTAGEIDKDQYRKFKIRTVFKQNDPAMMAEVIKRRVKHKEWKLPDLFLLDGGKNQYSAVINVLKYYKIKKPVIAIAKGPSRKGFSLIKNSLAKNIILERRFIESIRDEAHRFAISYHRKLKTKSIIK